MKVFLIIVSLSALICVGRSQEVTFYENANHEGKPYTVKLSGSCSNLPLEFNDRASSVDTKGLCIRVYDHYDCQGEPDCVANGTSGNFQSRLNHLVSSYKSCDICVGRSQEVTFYENANHEGKSYTVTLSGSCSNLPLEFNDRASSVDTKGLCIRVYDHYDCQGEPDCIANGTSGNFQSRLNHLVSSYKSCDICAGRSQEVTFYENANHEGKSYTVKLSGSCSNLPLEFNDRASSVDTKGLCIRVYDHYDCQGEPDCIANGTSGNFQSRLNHLVSSYKSCDICAGRSQEVTFYENANHEGKSYTVTLSGSCSNLPLEFNDRASSIDTKGLCILVYDHYDCQGKPDRIANGTSGNFQPRLNHFVSSYESCDTPATFET